MAVFRPPLIIRHYSWDRWWKGLDVQPNRLTNTLAPVAIPVSIVEAATATETESAVVTFAASITEAASAATTQSAVATYPASITEAATATDTPSAVATFPASVTEAASAATTQSAVAAYPASVTEAASATAAQDATAILNVSVTEAATATDTSDATQDTTRRPGSGKRYQSPTDYLPEPDYEAKPSKPFRPIWDKPKAGEIEEVAPEPAGPPPLPPAELFGMPGHAGAAKMLAPPALTLPNFAQYAPHDPVGLDQQMRDVMDRNDAIAVLKRLGLIPA